MGNASSTEQNQQSSSQNPLNRPRSHGGSAAASQPTTPGKASPSWSRHSSLKRPTGPSTPNHAAQQRNPLSREASAGSTPLVERSPSAPKSSVRSRGASVSEAHPSAAPPARERSATSSGSTTLPDPHLHRSISAMPAAGTAGGMLRRPSRYSKQKSIDLQDVESADSGLVAPMSTTNQSSRTLTSASDNALASQGRGDLSPAATALAGLAAKSALSPLPSPSIATDAQHAFGATSSDTGDRSPTRHFGILGQPGQSSSSSGPAKAPSVVAGRESIDEGAGDSGIIEESYPPTSSGPPTVDSLGRQIAAALPSYLKIPTLIPSKQQAATSSMSSSPVDPGTTSVPRSSVSSASAWNGIAGTAAKATDAVLTTEDVLLGPGKASRASSPVEGLTSPSIKSRELSSTGTSPSYHVGTEPSATSRPSLEAQAEQAATSTLQVASPETSQESEVGSAEAHSGSVSLSRTPTPTQKSHLAKAFTPSRAVPAAAGGSGDAESQVRRVHVATGLASGATTPVMPIPPGLTSAPPSANSPPVGRGYATPQSGRSQADLGSQTSVTPKTTSIPADDAATPTETTVAGSGIATTPKAKQQPLTPYYYKNSKGPMVLMPIVLNWRGGGKEVFVTGTFANEWRSKILLKKTAGHGAPHPGRRANTGKEEHTVVLHLPPGTHRLKFIVDDRWRVSRELPTATDGDGNLVNYLEIPNVGPAHSGPLSAPGEDLLADEGEREAERKSQRDVERIKEAERAKARRPGYVRGDSANATPTATSIKKADAAAAAVGEMSSTPVNERDPHEGELQREARRKAVMDLREEARKAELLRDGQLQEVFGIDEEALRAAETWVQDIPDTVVRAQLDEESYRDRLEAEEEQQHHSHRHHDDEDGPPVPPPPSLPRQLEKVILNSSPANPALAAAGGMVDDNSILPAPNHVVLNHLTASAIKGGVLAVGTTTRYKRKYVTTILYKPVKP